ncbi:CREB/ATF bZIP transcription factor [Pelodytes ibericus]
MRHRLRDRANITSATPPSRRHTTGRPVRRRGRKAASSRTLQVAVPDQSDHKTLTTDFKMGTEWSGQGYEGSFYSAGDMEEILDVEETSDWWKEEVKCPVHEDEPFADLLQQLVRCVDVDTPESQDGSQHEVYTGNMAPNCLSIDMAASDADKMAAFARLNDRCQGNKNALAARLNRQRKKEYVSGLESTVTRLSEENQQLHRERRSLAARIRDLEHETRYLRAVLTNDSALSKLLGRLTGLGGVRLSTSLFSDPPAGSDHDYAMQGIQQGEELEEEAPPSGVCLHVDKEKVSVEFCSSCARNASTAVKM